MEEFVIVRGVLKEYHGAATEVEKPAVMPKPTQKKTTSPPWWNNGRKQI